jgi:ketosteroid isomerase-like protein
MKIGLGLAALAMLAPLRLVAQAPSPAEQELARLENAWSTAIGNRDTTALSRLYAAEYIDIDQDGVVWSRDQDLANVATGDYRQASFSLTDLRIHIYGDAAVVNGLNTVTAAFRGRDVSGAYRFTDVFVKREGRWQCVSTQGTLVAHR